MVEQKGSFSLHHFQIFIQVVVDDENEERKTFVLQLKNKIHSC